MSNLSPNFVIGQIRIGTVESASCVNLGNNFPSNFNSNKKHNQGLGTITGDRNNLTEAQAVLNDPDIIDLFNTIGEEDIPVWVKEIINKLINNIDDQEASNTTPDTSKEDD